jgi:hypothetical protein
MGLQDCPSTQEHCYAEALPCTCEWRSQTVEFLGMHDAPSKAPGHFRHSESDDVGPADLAITRYVTPDLLSY